MFEHNPFPPAINEMYAEDTGDENSLGKGYVSDYIKMAALILELEEFQEETPKAA